MHSIICHVNAWVFFLAASLLAFTSFALDDDGIYFVDDSEVQAHLAARSEYIAREKRQRQGLLNTRHLFAPDSIED